MKLLALSSLALAQLVLARSHTQAVGLAKHQARSTHATSPDLYDTVNTVIKANDDGAAVVHNTLGATEASVDMTIDSLTALDDLNTAGVKATDNVLQQMGPYDKAIGVVAPLDDSIAANDDGAKAVHDTIDATNDSLYATNDLVQATDDTNLGLVKTLDSGLRQISNVARADGKASFTSGSSSASASAGDGSLSDVAAVLKDCDNLVSDTVGAGVDTDNVIGDTLRLTDGLNTEGVQGVDDSLSVLRPGAKAMGMSAAFDDIVDANDSGADAVHKTLEAADDTIALTTDTLLAVADANDAVTCPTNTGLRSGNSKVSSGITTPSFLKSLASEPTIDGTAATVDVMLPGGSIDKIIGSSHDSVSVSGDKNRVSSSNTAGSVKASDDSASASSGSGYHTSIVSDVGLQDLGSSSVADSNVDTNVVITDGNNDNPMNGDSTGSGSHSTSPPGSGNRDGSGSAAALTGSASHGGQTTNGDGVSGSGSGHSHSASPPGSGNRDGSGSANHRGGVSGSGSGHPQSALPPGSGNRDGSSLSGSANRDGSTLTGSANHGGQTTHGDGVSRTTFADGNRSGSGIRPAGSLPSPVAKRSWYTPRRRTSAPVCPSDKPTACGVESKTGPPWRCVDTKNDIDSCGGCTTPSPFRMSSRDMLVAPATGMNCGEIPNAVATSCEQGKCVVTGCQSGYEPSKSQDSCVETPDSE